MQALLGHQQDPLDAASGPTPARHTSLSGPVRYNKRPLTDRYHDLGSAALRRDSHVHTTMGLAGRLTPTECARSRPTVMRSAPERDGPSTGTAPPTLLLLGLRCTWCAPFTVFLWTGALTGAAWQATGGN